MINWIKLLIITLWMAFAITAYLHLYPFTALLSGLPSISGTNIFSGIAHLFPHLLALFFILFAANGWGLYFWFDQHLQFNEKFAFATGTGLGVMSLAILLANFFGIAGNNIFLIMLFSGSIAFVFTISRVYTGTAAVRPSWLTALCLLPIGSALIGALAAPTQFDSLCYHLALPAQYIMSGQMFRVPHNFFFAFPQNTEMLFQLGLTIDNDILANLIHWAFLPLLALPLHTLAKRYQGERAAWLATLMWCCTPAVMFLATGTYIDLALTFYLFLSIHSIILWYSSRHERWLTASGIFLGLGIGTKYTAALYGIPLSLLVIYNLRNLREILVFSFTTIAVFSPWLIKNIVYLGNPIAPWGAGLFASSGITQAQAAIYFDHIRGHGLSIHSLMDIIKLPWNITAFGYTFGGAFDIIGPVFLIFIPMIILSRRLDKIRLALLAYTVIAFILWAATGKVLRFLLPLTPLLCMLSAEGIIQAIGISVPVPWRDKLRIIMRQPPPSSGLKFSAAADQSVIEAEHAFRNTLVLEFAAKTTIYPVLAIALLHNILFFHWVMASPDPYSTVLRGTSRNEYLSSKVNYYGALNEYINKLPSAKVLFLGETRGYYCRKPALVPTYFDANPFFPWANNAPDALALHKTIHQQRITHILLNQAEFARLGFEKQLTPKGRINFDQLQANFLTIEYADKNTRVYKVNPQERQTK
jgi:hypothetical protein